MFDLAKFEKAYHSGHSHLLFDQLKDHGIAFDESQGPMKWLHPEIVKRAKYLTWDMAMDIQSELALQPSSGIPAYLATIFNPELIPVVVSPLEAANIAGERMFGSWEDEVLQFNVGETVGETSAYGDYNMNGASNVNTNYPARQNFLFQAFLQYGDREVARYGLTKVDWASEQQNANIDVLRKGLNYQYFYGVTGLDNYGLINDPSLFSSITPTYSWLTSASATANTIYADVVRLFVQLQAQSNGVVKNDSPMVLALSPQNETTFLNVTLYNTNSVHALLKQNFPKLRVVTAVQYATTSGQLVQLIAEAVDGRRTVECAFSSKLKAHRMVFETSSVKQKRSSGGWGTIWYRNFLCASMLG